MPTQSAVLAARGRTGPAKKSGDVARIEAAYRDLATEKIAAYIERTVADAPPLTDRQLARLAALLTAASSPAGRPLRRPVKVDEALADAPDHIALMSAPGGDDQ